MPAHRGLNVLTYLVIEGVDKVDEREQVYAELTGPLRTVGEERGGLPERERDAPSWWHGEAEEARKMAAHLGLSR
jgi:hypothetical protein